MAVLPVDMKRTVAVAAAAPEDMSRVEAAVVVPSRGTTCAAVGVVDHMAEMIIVTAMVRTTAAIQEGKLNFLQGCRAGYILIRLTPALVQNRPALTGS